MQQINSATAAQPAPNPSVDQNNGLPPAFELMCLKCDWTGQEADLKFPHYILDDDMPDYGGDCPECGANFGNGEIEEVSMPYALPGKPPTWAEIAVTVLVVLGMLAFGIGLNAVEGVSR